MNANVNERFLQKQIHEYENLLYLHVCVSVTLFSCVCVGKCTRREYPSHVCVYIIVENYEGAIRDIFLNASPPSSSYIFQPVFPYKLPLYHPHMFVFLIDSKCVKA